MTQNTVPAQGADIPVSYEAAMQELEGLVARLDTGQLPLDELLVQYQRGAHLLQFCRTRLDAVEQQIQVMESGVQRPWSESV